MVRKRSPSNKDIQQSKNDDLKLINGIGPAVENRLNDVGIYTFAQLAALSPADIAAAVAGLAGQSAERITKQDWIGQARSLTVELASSEAQKYLEHATEQSALTEHTHATTPFIEPQHTGEPESIQSETKKEAETPAETEQVAMFIAPVEPTPPIEDAHTKTLTAEAQKETETIMSKGQSHPATFMVELLLDENNIVHRARAMHVESQREHSWSNWPKLELVDFLEKSAEVNILPVEAVPAEPAPANAQELEHVPVLAAESTPLAEMPALTGTLHLRDMKILGTGSPEPRSLLPHDQPFDVRVTLDLSEMSVPANIPLNYRASIYGKSRGSRAGQTVGEAEGTIKPTDTVTINVEGIPLPEGTYRLAATVMVALPGMKLIPRPSTMAIIDTGPVQVY